MDVITHQQLRDLIEAGKPPCVSIFMPTHREREVRQDSVRLKNLIRDAEQRLAEGGMRPTLAHDFLAPARKLLDDPDFWAHNDHGLAIYVSEGFSRVFRLPLEVEEPVLVNERFDIKPLLTALRDELFYVIAIAQNDVRVLQCTKQTCKQVALPADVPKSIEEAIFPGDGHESQTVRYSGNASNPASISGGFHGQTPDNQHKVQEDRMYYYRQVDDGFRRIAKDPNAFVVLAGADSTVPFYRQAAHHKNICQDWIHGNAEHVANETVHEQAIRILQPIWNKRLSELQEQYGTAYAHHLASDNINQIVPAAAQGRVGVLFVAPKKRCPGKFDSQNLFVDDRSEEEDLVDAAAFQTLMTGGQLVVVEPNQLPGSGEVAAIYRYLA